jgi:hypothetical protein
MKNTLAENMLRFGVKNLSESDLQKLNEQAEWNKNMGDPAWINAAAIAANPGHIEQVFPSGTTYVQQYSYAAKNNGESMIIIMPKGTQWTLSPSKYFLMAKAVKVTSSNFGYGGEMAEFTGLKDGMYLAKVAQGKGVGNDGKPVTTAPVFVAFTPAAGGVLVQNEMNFKALNYPNQNLYKKLASLA